MEFLFKNIKIICLFLTLIIAITGVGLFLTETIELIDLLFFLGLIQLLVIFYAIVIIYYRWTNQHIINLNEKVDGLSNLDYELKKSLDSNIQDFKKENTQQLEVSFDKFHKGLVKEIDNKNLNIIDRLQAELDKKTTLLLQHNEKLNKVLNLITDNSSELLKLEHLLKQESSNNSNILSLVKDQVQSTQQFQQMNLSKIDELSVKINTEVKESILEKQLTLLSELNINKEKIAQSTSNLLQNMESSTKDLKESSLKNKNNLADWTKKQFESIYCRIDALFSIHSLLDIKAPLPFLNEWRVTSDYAHELLCNMLGKTSSVIDIGSGVSTIILGYAMQQNNLGKVIALEHDKKYFEETMQLIKLHQLEKYCSLHYCPLKEYKINDEKWLWYDISEVNFPSNIGLISIDGPPADTQSMARYPAIPLLEKFITNETSIYIDDGNREDERKIAERWTQEFNLKVTSCKEVKGYYKLQKDNIGRVKEKT